MDTKDQKMRVTLSAIVSDVTSGRWFNYTVTSSETEVSRSHYNAKEKDTEQVEALKAEAYRLLMDELTGKQVAGTE
jgi:hypothetical protein